MQKTLVGYQLYSARDDAAKDLLSVLKQVRDMGYDGVEFAGYYGHSASDIVKMLKETGLQAASAHVSIPDTEAGRFEAVAILAELHCKYVAIPYLDEAHRPGSAGFAKTIAEIYRFAELTRQAGIQLLYHNHDFEFIELSGQFGLDFLYDAVPAPLLKTEIDTCWVKFAGHDPAAYIRKYAGRSPVVHLKDFVGGTDGKQPYALLNADGGDGGQGESKSFEFRPVGYGVQNFPPIIEASRAGGAEWFIVEQDISVGRTPLEAAKMSRDYLKSIGV